MTEHALRLLIQSACQGLLDNRADSRTAVNTIIRETLRFREKLSREIGHDLSLDDTRTALEALGQLLGGGRMPSDLSAEQRALTQIWVDHLTLFST